LDRTSLKNIDRVAKIYVKNNLIKTSAL